MVSYILRYSDGVVTHLCDSCGRATAARLDLRLPREHEHAATTRRGSGRTGMTVTVSRAPQTDDWLYHVRCAHCSAPSTDEINAFLRGA